MLLIRGATQAQAPRGRRSVAADDGLERLPVGLRVDPAAGGLVLTERRVGHGEAERPDAGHVLVEELLAQLFVGFGLEAPHQKGVIGRRIRGPEEVHDRLPPAVERLLEHGALRPRAGGQLECDILAVLEV